MAKAQLMLVRMIQELPRVGSDSEPLPCHMNAAFTQLKSVAQGQLLARVYCAGCPALSDCTLLAVRTLEDFGSLFGVWAGQVFSLEGHDRT